MSFGSDIAGGIAARMAGIGLCLLGAGIGIGFGISWIPTLIIYLSNHLTWTP